MVGVRSLIGTLVAVCGLASFGFPSADAGTLVVSESQGNLAAQATCEIVGGDLQITLRNIGGDVLVPSDVLQGLTPLLAPMRSPSEKQILTSYQLKNGFQVHARE